MPDLSSPISLGRRWRSSPKSISLDRGGRADDLASLEASAASTTDDVSKGLSSVSFETNPSKVTLPSRCDARDEEDVIAMAYNTMEARAAARDNEPPRRIAFTYNDKKVKRANNDEETSKKKSVGSAPKANSLGALVENMTANEWKGIMEKDAILPAAAKAKKQAALPPLLMLRSIGEDQIEDAFVSQRFRYDGLGDPAPRNEQRSVSSFAGSRGGRYIDLDNASVMSKSTHQLLEQQALLENAPAEAREEFYDALSRLAVLNARAQSQKAELALKRIELEKERIGVQSLRVDFESRFVDCVTTVCHDDKNGDDDELSMDSTLRTNDSKRREGARLARSINDTLDDFVDFAAEKGGEGANLVHRALADLADQVLNGLAMVKERLERIDERAAAESVRVTPSFAESARVTVRSANATVKMSNGAGAGATAIHEPGSVAAREDVDIEASSTLGSECTVSTNEVEIAMAEVERIRALRDAALVEAESLAAEAEAVTARLEVERREALSWSGLRGGCADETARAPHEIAMDAAAEAWKEAGRVAAGWAAAVASLVGERSRESNGAVKAKMKEANAKVEAARAEAEAARAEAARTEAEVEAAREELRRAVEEMKGMIEGTMP